MCDANAVSRSSARQVLELHRLSEAASVDAAQPVRFVLNERACVRLLEFDFLRDALRSSSDTVPDECVQRLCFLPTAPR